MNHWYHQDGRVTAYPNPGPLEHPAQLWRDSDGHPMYIRRHQIWGHMGQVTVNGQTVGEGELILAGWRRVFPESVDVLPGKDA